MAILSKAVKEKVAMAVHSKAVKKERVPMAIPSQAVKKERVSMAIPSPAIKERVLMAVPSQAVSETERAMKEGTAWDCIKLHLTIDKIIVLFMIAFLWMFSTVPLFIFYFTPSQGQVREWSQVGEVVV